MSHKYHIHAPFESARFDHLVQIDQTHGSGCVALLVEQAGPAGEWDSNIPVFDACCVFKENGFYKMYYNGTLGSFPFGFMQTGLATSTDGIHWVKYNDPTTTAAPYAFSDPVLKVGGVGQWDALHLKGACVLPAADGYEMWYSGLRALGPYQWIGYATSSDGILWTKWPENPILDSCPTWGNWGYTPGTVLKLEGKYHLWYASFDAGGDYPKIGYATSTITSVHEKTSDYLPNKFLLYQNYPNPFNSQTVIEYAVSLPAHVSLAIYNALGQKIATVINELHQAGYFRAIWDGKNSAGRIVPSGVYFYRLETESFSEVKKMLYLQ